MASAVTANYFQVFGMPGAWAFVHRRRGTARRRDPRRDHQLSALGAARRRPGHVGPARAHHGGEHFTVVGVAREGFAGTSIPGPEVWLPLGAHETFSTEDPAGRPFGARETHELSVVGRLRPGISVETAAAATIATVGRRLEQAFPSVNAGYSIVMSKPSSRLMFMPGEGAARLRAWPCS